VAARSSPAVAKSSCKHTKRSGKSMVFVHKKYPGKSPQTEWGSGRVMYDNVDDADVDADDDDGDDDMIR
jgi:hypothetical protein